MANEVSLDLKQAYSNLIALLDAEYPSRDYYESAARLGKVDVGDRTVGPFYFELGDLRTFYSDEGEHEAELLAVTDNTYFWVETSLALDEDIIALAASRFEKEFYPGLGQIFGTEWRPGIDNDPRFSILHLDGYGDNNDLGFFNSSDEYPNTINEFSNEQEIIYLNMRNLTISEDLYFGTLVHEYQHLMQWNADHNETVWLSEGLAQFAELYTGLNTADSDLDYWSNPDVQLNSWEYENEDELFAHYGAAYLFVVYFWEQMGDEAIRELIQHKADGIAAVRHVLAIYQPETTLEQFFGDWTVANYLDNRDVAEPYRYATLRLQRPVHTQEITSLPMEVNGNVNQYAADYIEIKNSGPVTILFEGDSSIDLFDAAVGDGDLIWFVPALDEIDATLETTVDLPANEAAMLEFTAWFDLEEDYDFAYVSVSSDAGQTWELLTPVNASLGEFGPAFGGQSAKIPGSQGGWISEQISLEQYAGRQVIIRFEVLTAPATTGAGFALDDIVVSPANDGPTNLVPELEWRAKGFVRTGHHLSQQWQIRLIPLNFPNRVMTLPLDALNHGQWQLDLGNEGGVLVITALTPFVSSPANYRLNLN
jgi:hypothetical protein